MSKFSNPEAYEKRSVPRPRDEVLDSIDAFFDGVYDLAQKHGIADVGLSVRCPQVNVDGYIALRVAAHIGNQDFSVELAHNLYEKMKLERRISSLQRQAEKRLEKGLAKGVR
jgi:hypothetical protein